MIAEGIWNILLETKDGETVLVEDVSYVPNMSVGQLIEKGF